MSAFMLQVPQIWGTGGGGVGERWFLHKISRFLSLSSPSLPLAGAHDKVPHTLLSVGSLSNDFSVFFWAVFFGDLQETSD